MRPVDPHTCSYTWNSHVLPFPSQLDWKVFTVFISYIIIILSGLYRWLDDNSHTFYIQLGMYSPSCPVSQVIMDSITYDSSLRMMRSPVILYVCTLDN